MKNEQFDTKLRERQVEFLEMQYVTASLCNERRYMLTVNDKTIVVHCAETALMLLDSEYAEVNVILKATR